jgi:hypothetical protein
MTDFVKSHVEQLINANKNLLLKLDKFKHLNEYSSNDGFINAMKIKIVDITKLYLDLKAKNRVMFFNIDELKLINSNKSFPFNASTKMTNEEIISELKIVQSDLSSNVTVPASKYMYKFFDLYDSINVNARPGGMSFSLCTDNKTINDIFDNMCMICRKQNCNCINITSKDDKSASVSLNPKYYGVETKESFGRISFYKNTLPLYLYDFTSSNYKNRYIFRTIVTKLILGTDYFDKIIIHNIKPTVEFFKDYTIGQEIYYYFLELYNYDRNKYLLHSFNTFTSVFNKGKFEEFYNSAEVIDSYPPFDGVLYFDHAIHNNIDYPGTECFIFNKELVTKFVGSKFNFNNTFYKSPDINNAINDFITYLANPTDLTPMTNICENFDKQQIGGDYYKNKYLKYKKKYNYLKYNTIL